MEKIHQYLRELYPSQAHQLAKELERMTKQVKHRQPRYGNPTWYKNMNLYVVYAGALSAGRKPPFDSLIDHLPRIKELGCNALHVLPFLDSPLKDKGFDVRDYLKVHPDMGTVRDVQRFMKAADEEGVRVFMDLVFNHVSDQHEWFKKA